MVKIYEAKFYPEIVKVVAYETLEMSKKDVEWTNAYVDGIEAWLDNNGFNGTTTEAPGSGTRFKIHAGVILVVLMFILYVI